MTSGWESVALGEVLTRADRFESRDDTNDYRFAGTYSYARGIFFSGIKRGATFKLDKIQRIRSGDFVYCKIMAWEGAFGLVPDELDQHVMSGAFIAYEIDQSKLEPRFLDWYFKVSTVWKGIGGQSSGTNVRRQSLHPSQFEAATIPLPPLEEQRRIVARVEALAARIEEARGLRKYTLEAKRLLASQVTATVFQSLALEHGVSRLGSLLVDACYGTSAKSVYERSENDLPVLRIPNVVSEKVEWDDLKFASLPAAEMTKLLLKSGDILVVRTNGSADLVGRCAVIDEIPEPAVFASYMIRLQCDTTRVIPEFVRLSLKHLRDSGQLIDFARTTAGQYNVSLGRLREAFIPTPSLTIQKAVLERSKRIQNQILDLERLQTSTRLELDALLPSVLAKAFAGEL